MSQNSPQSFSAGQTMPWKLMQSRTAIVDGRIHPLHIKLYPTNRCNARCRFCTIQKWAKDEELPFDELRGIIERFHSLGTRAITISGGGEPTLHPDFDRLLDVCRKYDVQIGLITNGLLWSDSEKTLHANGKLVWARMSVVDPESGTYDTERLRRFARNLSEVAVGCYAAITKEADEDTIARLADIAEEAPNITHFKLAEDTVNGAEEKMNRLQERLQPGRPKLIFHRHAWTERGMKDCRVSLLRPVVAADGYVYPCCSMELEDEGQVKPDKFKMAHWREFGLDTPHFDGSICPKCIWADYNKALAGLTARLEHERFV